MPDKQKVIEGILAHLDREIAVLTEAAKAAYEAATHEESKAEDQHDTRGVEASYLAGAQAKRVAELKKQSLLIKGLPTREVGPSDPISPGALVELDRGGRRFFGFLLPLGGGYKVQVGEKTVQIISSQAPLGEALVGKRVGDIVEVEAQKTMEYEIIAVF